MTYNKPMRYILKVTSAIILLSVIISIVRLYPVRFHTAHAQEEKWDESRLLIQLTNDDKWSKIDALYTIGKSGLYTNSLLQAMYPSLNSDDFMVRRYATFALSQLKPAHPSVVENLQNALKRSSNVYETIWLIRALGNIGTEAVAAVPLLKEFLQQRFSPDDHKKVGLRNGFQSEANAALSKIVIRQRSPIVDTDNYIAQLVHPDGEIRRKCWYALPLTQEEAKYIVPKLVQMLETEKEKEKIITALANIGTDEAIAPLLPMLKPPTSSQAVLVLYHLEHTPNSSVQLANALTEALESTAGLSEKSPIVHARIVNALVRFSYSMPSRPHIKAIPALRRIAVENDDAQVRAFAINALGSMGREREELREAVPTIINAILNDNNISVRKAAIEALTDIGNVTPDVIPALAKALNDKDATVRSTAQFAVEKFKLNAKNMLPTLQKMH